MGKISAFSEGDTEDMSLILGQEDLLEEERHPIQYSCLENSEGTEEPSGLYSMGLKEADMT